MLKFGNSRQYISPLHEILYKNRAVYVRAALPRLAKIPQFSENIKKIETLTCATLQIVQNLPRHTNERPD